jgi:protein-tyrosine phosphatase
MALHRFFKPEHRSLDISWLTPELAIGAAPEDADWPRVIESGVKAVLDLRAEADDNEALVTGVHGLHYLRLPIAEYEAPWLAELRLVVEWAIQRLHAREVLLLHCREGRGRSAMVGCAVLVRLGAPLEDAYRMLLGARPQAALSPPQEKLLQRYASALEDERDL